MSRKFPLLNLGHAQNLLAAGALILDELDYYDTVDETEVLGAPIFLNRGQIGVVPEGVLEYLSDQSDDVSLKANKPLYVRDTLAVPPLVNRFWFHRDNEDAALLAVEINYTHDTVSHLDVVLNTEDTLELDTDEPAIRRIYEALGLPFDEEDEEDEDEDEETVEDDTSLLEYTVTYRTPNGEKETTTVEAVDTLRAQMAFESDPRFADVQIVNIELATDDGTDDSEDE